MPRWRGGLVSGSCAWEPSRAMSQGLTYEQAATILGCHFSNVAKLIRKGDLTSTGKRASASTSSRLSDAPPNAVLPSERPRPPCHPVSTSAWIIAPITSTSGCRSARSLGFSASPGCGHGSCSSRQTASRRKQRTLLGAARSPGAGGGGAAGAEDATALGGRAPRWQELRRVTGLVGEVAIDSCL